MGYVQKQWDVTNFLQQLLIPNSFPVLKSNKKKVKPAFLNHQQRYHHAVSSADTQEQIKAQKSSDSLNYP